jgi:hypothetical protein
MKKYLILALLLASGSASAIEFTPWYLVNQIKIGNSVICLYEREVTHNNGLVVVNILPRFHFGTDVCPTDL